jgi:hypothetical protein
VRVRSRRLVLASIVLAGAVGVGVSLQQTALVEGQSGAPTGEPPPTPIGGIPTNVATDVPQDIPTTDPTKLARGTATTQPWVGNTPSVPADP